MMYTSLKLLDVFYSLTQFHYYTSLKLLAIIYLPLILFHIHSSSAISKCLLKISLFKLVLKLYPLILLLYFGISVNLEWSLLSKSFFSLVRALATLQKSGQLSNGMNCILNLSVSFFLMPFRLLEEDIFLKNCKYYLDVYLGSVSSWE